MGLTENVNLYLGSAGEKSVMGGIPNNLADTHRSMLRDRGLRCGTCMTAFVM